MSLATCECHLPGRFEVLGREGAHSTIYVGRGGRKGWRLPCQAGCAELSFTQNSQFVGGQVKPDEIKADSWSVGSKPIGYVICVNPCLNMGLAWAWVDTHDCCWLGSVEARVWTYSVIYGLVMTVGITVPFRWLGNTEADVDVVSVWQVLS